MSTEFFYNKRIPKAARTLVNVADLFLQSAWFLPVNIVEEFHFHLYSMDISGMCVYRPLISAPTSTQATSLEFINDAS